VLLAAASPPTKYFSFFLTSLLETVRINIGECVAVAYINLTLAAATKILMFENDQVRWNDLCCFYSMAYPVMHSLLCCDPMKETLEFIGDFYPGWEVDVSRGTIALSDVKMLKSEEMPSLKLICQNLSYATELERIV
jgi:hypothetical protein